MKMKFLESELNKKLAFILVASLCCFSSSKAEDEYSVPIISVLSHSDPDYDSKLYQKFKPNEMAEVLKNVPKWNSEIKRWYLYADLWTDGHDGNYSMKGNYFNIVLKIPELKLEVYKSPSFKSTKLFELGNTSIFKDGKEICSSYSKPNIKATKISTCKYAFCTFHGVKKEVPMEYTTTEMIDIKKGPCPFQLDFEYYKPKSEETELSFPLLSETVSVNDKFLKIKVNNQYGYLSLKDCNTKYTCRLRNIKISGLEKLFLLKEYYAREKSIRALNELQKFLRPCLIKKDISCIRKHFVTKKEFLAADNREVFLSQEGFEETNLDTSTINELKACLNYSSLLHVGSTTIVLKGINKACIISNLVLLEFQPPSRGRAKILSVTYPEAVRHDGEFPIDYVLEGEK